MTTTNMHADDILNLLNKLFKIKIVYGLDNGGYTFAVLVDKVYLRCIKHIEGMTFLNALKYFIENSYIEPNINSNKKDGVLLWLNNYIKKCKECC